VVVTGTVVGVVVVATGFVVVVVVGAVVETVVFDGEVVEETGEVVVECAVVVVEGAIVVDVGAAVVVVVFVGETTSVLALEAKNPTRAADDNPEPTRRPWVMRRTRANCRSRCWGVREDALMGTSSLAGET
jgi:hypothetical protein